MLHRPDSSAENCSAPSAVTSQQETLNSPPDSLKKLQAVFQNQNAHLLLVARTACSGTSLDPKEILTEAYLCLAKQSSQLAADKLSLYLYAATAIKAIAQTKVDQQTVAEPCRITNHQITQALDFPYLID